MAKKIIIISSLLFTSLANAANWGFFVEAQGVKQYFDRSSLKVDSQSNTVSFWEKRVGNIGIEKGKKVASLVGYDKFYCDERSYQVIEIHYYDSKGKLIYSDLAPSDKVRIIPDSISEEMYEVACKNIKK